MSVRMYDCGFGDCFCIMDEYVDRPLFVDFGVNTFSKVGKKTLTYMKVLQDMQQLVNEGGIDFLLTHYHTDHFSGLMHLIRNRERCVALSCIRFENVYIPNVWNIANSREVVMALLLSYLPRHGKRKMNIIDFLMAICQTGGCVHLINRGSVIGDALIALWPPKDLTVENYFREIDGGGEEFLTRLSDIADRLINIVHTLILNQENRTYTDALFHLKTLRTRFYELCQTAPHIDENTEIRLNTFGNEISIVFQNIHKEAGERNILFTGDVHSKAWNDMETLQLQDGIFLHEQYGVIKVPHHGTETYYHDFGEYIPDSQEIKFLIPNGDMKKFGHKISSHYPNSLRGAFVCCSNNNNCEEETCCRRCTCDPYRVVSTSPSFLI